MVRTHNYLILAGTALLSVRLYWLRLRPKYKAFFYYLIFSTLQTGFMMQLDNSWRGKVYPYAYVATEPIGWVFYVLVVLELYSLVLADYQGLYTVGRWGLFIGVTMALLASSLSLLVPSHGPPQGSRILPYYYVVERAVYFEPGRLSDNDSIGASAVSDYTETQYCRSQRGVLDLFPFQYDGVLAVEPARLRFDRDSAIYPPWG